MHLSPKGAAFVRLHEGFRAKAYRDPTGTITIAAGMTWASQAFRAWWSKNRPGQKFGLGSTMTEAESDEVLRIVFDEEYGAAVNRFLGKDVPQHVFDAMASLTFNAGPGALKWKWAAAAKRGDYAEAARLMSTTATTSKGKKLPGLVRRRKEEALLMERGIYTGVDGKAVKPAPKPKPSTAVTVETIRHVQTRLRDLGYTEVGPADGSIGPLTRTGILAFRNENDLPISVEIDDTLLTALAKATPRKLERNDTKREEVVQKVPEVRANWLSRVGALIVGVPAAVGAVVDGVLGNVGAARGVIEPLQDFASGVPGWAWLVLVGIAAASLYIVAKNGEDKGVEAFREGSRR